MNMLIIGTKKTSKWEGKDVGCLEGIENIKDTLT